jgi:hypothetical protein
VEPIVLGVFILHFVLFVNYKDSEYFLFLRYLIPILLLTIVGYLTLPISGGFKLRNFGGTKLRITTIPRQNPPFPLPGDGSLAAPPSWHFQLSFISCVPLVASGIAERSGAEKKNQRDITHPRPSLKVGMQPLLLSLFH